MIQNKYIYEKTIRDFYQLKIIYLEQSTDNTRYISMNPGLLRRIIYNQDYRKQKIEILKIIFYIFPKNRYLEFLHFYSIAISILPQFKYILSFLDEIDIEQIFPTIYIIEIYLLTLYYLTLNWKNNILTKTDNIEIYFLVNTQL